MKQSSTGLLLFQSMRLASAETIGASTGIRSAGRTLYERSNSKRTRISSSILTEADSSSVLSFARREGSYYSNNFIELLKTFAPDAW